MKNKDDALIHYGMAECKHCNGRGRVASIDHAATGFGMQIARKARGLTLKVVAKRAGFSIGYLSDLEHGRRKWSVERLERVRDAIWASK